MANTISIQATLTVQGDTLAVQCSGSKPDIAQASGKLATGKVQNIGTGANGVALDFGFSSVGYVFVKNLGPTNYVELGLAGTTFAQSFAKLRVNEFCLVPVTQDAMFAKANTAAVDLLICAAQI